MALSFQPKEAGVLVSQKVELIVGKYIASLSGFSGGLLSSEELQAVIINRHKAGSQKVFMVLRFAV